MQSQSRGKQWERGGGLNKPASPPITNTDTKKCDTDIYTATSIPSLQSCPEGLWPLSLVAGSSSHPPTTWPLAPCVGTIRSDPAADLACTILFRYGLGAPAPFHLPQPSTRGPDRNLDGTRSTLCFPPSRARAKFHNFMTPQQPLLIIVSIKTFQLATVFRVPLLAIHPWG